MEFHGKQRLGSELTAESAVSFGALDPRTNEPLPGTFHEATLHEITRAMELAASATLELRAHSGGQKADLLDSIASHIEGLGELLLERASQESGLPIGRFQGERGRTCAQLRMFATLLREGSWVDARIDTADAQRSPLPRPDTRRMARALGPVVVFGASNFPLAFSVAGGDTASALAAGCPVVVKAHPKHPGTSELVGEAIHAAVVDTGFPSGTFSLIQGESVDVGLALVLDPRTRAVGFTGSLKGGRALFDAAVSRPDPIPVYAEMGSVNPTIFLPRALENDAAVIAKGLVQSVTMGVGQFCTNPGVVLTIAGEATEHFLHGVADAMREAAAHPMLHSGIRESYDGGISRHAATAGVDLVVQGRKGEGPCDGRPALLRCSAATFLAEPVLQEEVFGPCTIVVVCEDRARVAQVVDNLEGQLTGTIFGASAEDADLVARLEAKVGRVVFDGFPTGVEVCASMQHGGPYPATTDARTTSVGTAAIERFVRPVCYQNCPSALLPEELQDANPLGLWRLVDGHRSRDDIR
ncbi:MAG: aldehyde dehydrogenase (NADP(+)) [Planctomycetes bacterium]|nr:aldehyde dehydrogenase (NADP(+)) [Planctomycetota bacterium]MCB9891078.1 aldehyde dehydrogenase (NADP(+)) [Planctomycetota bacterium]MCB9916961.1 aldehyde dehydrogenase (NADP(+)) [Planctomycetota bacterium]